MEWPTTPSPMWWNGLLLPAPCDGMAYYSQPHVMEWPTTPSPMWWNGLLLPAPCDGMAYYSQPHVMEWPTTPSPMWWNGLLLPAPCDGMAYYSQPHVMEWPTTPSPMWWNGLLLPAPCDGMAYYSQPHVMEWPTTPSPMWWNGLLLPAPCDGMAYYSQPHVVEWPTTPSPMWWNGLLLPAPCDGMAYYSQPRVMEWQSTLRWDLRSKPRNILKKVASHFIQHIFSYLCGGNCSTKLLLFPCAVKWYVECLYRHFFLEDTCTNINVTKKKSSPQVLKPTCPRMMDNKNTKLGVWVARGLSCDTYWSDSQNKDCRQSLSAHTSKRLVLCPKYGAL